MGDKRPAEFYRLTLTSILGERLPTSEPRAPRPTWPAPTGGAAARTDEPVTAASVKYLTDMGNIDLLHEHGEWGVVIESFHTGVFHAAGQTEDNEASRASTNTMFVDIPELSVGGSFRLEEGDASTPNKRLIGASATQSMRLGTCVNTSSIGPAISLLERALGTMMQMHMESPQLKPTRCRCAPMLLQSLTVNLLDETGRPLNTTWLRDALTNIPEVNGTPIGKAQMGADYTMTLRFERMER